jgi:type I restriction enzyme R subunit
MAESDLEAWMMDALAARGFAAARGAEIAPDAPGSPRLSFHDTILAPVLRDALARLNPNLPPAAVEEVVRRVTDPVFATDLVAENRRLHGLLVSGVPVTVLVGGEERHEIARLVDWQDADNAWTVYNQVDVVGQATRIPDVVVFLNGMPLVVVELKGLEGGTMEAAHNQIETYKADIPDLFRTALISVISDGYNAAYGSLSAGLDRFMPWRTVDGETVVKTSDRTPVDVLTHGLLDRRVLLELLRRFVVFEDEGAGPIKKVAGYHQFHAVLKALESIRAARISDGKGGVLWHTQGSGKSLLMTFLTGALMRDPTMENPTIVVLTDRNDLDNQLFATFGRCTDLLGEAPVQAGSVDELKTLLARQVGGIVFSTIQKFRPERGEDFPELTGRSNVVVLVDEAHRTQYGFESKLDRTTGDLRRGLAWQLRRALPNAVYVAFTGTPVDLVGANTRAVFGDYIDVYDIAQAVEDGATVPIYYEARVAKIDLDEDVAETLDTEFDEVTEDLEDAEAGAIARRWSRVEALVGADARLDAVVADILQHFDARLEAIDGKAMIVCMSRRICVEVYDRIVAARPDWHGDTDDTGAVKVVMTGNASDPQPFQPHIRPKARQEVLRKRFKDPADPLKLVIVRDMWLTGFDAPCMHTLYIDKPMQGHGLMQAIARVNRVFRGKPSGLVVDYIGLAADLKKALNHYSQADQAETGIDQTAADTAFLDALAVVRAFFHGLDMSAGISGTREDRMALLPKAMEHILAVGRKDPDAKVVQRYVDTTAKLTRAFKIASGGKVTSDHADEVAFYAAVRAALEKADAGGVRRAGKTADFAVERLLNAAVASTEVVDILEACGFDRPDISVLSDAFLIEVAGMKHKNLAVEALKKLLNGEIQTRTRTNVVRREAFSERLASAIARYHNRGVDALQILQELIEIAKDLAAEPDDYLNEQERAFYDALAQNESAIEVMSNEDLRIIATELVATVRNTAGQDWWRRENIRGKMRAQIRRILKRYGYPPDLQVAAVSRVIRQAEALSQALGHTT